MKLYPILLIMFILTAILAVVLFATDLKAENNHDQAIRIVTNYRTNGTVSFQVLPVTNHGQYTPRNIGAIWVTTESGTFVKTLQRWGTHYLNYLSAWHACTSTGNTTGAITGATMSSHSLHNVNWDCKNTSGAEVPDGNYKIWIEYTESDGTGPSTSVTFTKGANAVHLTPANLTYFHNILLDFAPAAVIGAPTNLQASLAGVNTVNLTWSAPASTTGLTAYKVYRNGSLISTITTVSTTTYTDTPSLGSQTYVVTALFGTTESTQSNVATVTINPVIEAPVNLQATVVNVNNVTLTWSAPVSTLGLTGYCVYRDGAMLTTLASTVTSYTDITTPGDHTYYVTAMYSTTESAASNTALVTITANNDGIQSPYVTSLNGNYPNPFNPTTNISFSLANNQYVDLSVYNFKGQKVKVLASGNMTTGNHVVSWDGTDGNGHKAASGLYYYKLQTSNNTLIKKMVMLK